MQIANGVFAHTRQAYRLLCIGVQSSEHRVAYRIQTENAFSRGSLPSKNVQPILCCDCRHSVARGSSRLVFIFFNSTHFYCALCAEINWRCDEEKKNIYTIFKITRPASVVKCGHVVRGFLIGAHFEKVSVHCAAPTVSWFGRRRFRIRFFFSRAESESLERRRREPIIFRRVN